MHLARKSPDSVSTLRARMQRLSCESYLFCSDVVVCSFQVCKDAFYSVIANFHFRVLACRSCFTPIKNSFNIL